MNKDLPKLKEFRLCSRQKRCELAERVDGELSGLFRRNQLKFLFFSGEGTNQRIGKLRNFCWATREAGLDDASLGKGVKHKA
jgi:hypothetical protein